MPPALGHEPHRRQVEGADPLLRGQRRDHPLQRPAGKLVGISNTVLASSLRELERDGLILRREYLEVPVRVEYAPTEDCRRLLPILEQLSDWAEARMPADGSTTKKEEPQ